MSNPRRISVDALIAQVDQFNAMQRHTSPPVAVPAKQLLMLAAMATIGCRQFGIHHGGHALSAETLDRMRKKLADQCDRLILDCGSPGERDCVAQHVLVSVQLTANQVMEEACELLDKLEGGAGGHGADAPGGGM